MHSFLLEIYHTQGTGQHVGFVNHAVCPTLPTLDQKELLTKSLLLELGRKFRGRMSGKT
jgi:hypothetical protein